MAPAKERMKKSRDKKKKDPDKWDAHLEKERQRDKQRRQKMKTALVKDQKGAARIRKKIRDRVRACRERKKLAFLNIGSVGIDVNQHSPIGAYKSVQTFGTEVNKVKRLLPENPNKKNAMLKKIVADVIGFKIGDRLKVFPKKPSVSINEDQKKSIIDFFCQDDISHQAPGIKDYITIKGKDGKAKQKVHKRHLVMSVGEAYQEFKKAFPDLKVGKSKFYSLRPSHVLLHSAKLTVCTRNMK